MNAVDTESEDMKIEDCICADCFEGLFSSHHNEGWFRVSRFFSWLRKGRKDMRRFL